MTVSLQRKITAAKFMKCEFSATRRSSFRAATLVGELQSPSAKRNVLHAQLCVTYIIPGMGTKTGPDPAKDTNKDSNKETL